MKVSFDLDGTAWKHREFFANLAKALQVAGHEVGILTAHADDIRDADLRLWRSRGFPEPNFFYNAADMAGIGGTLRDRKLTFAKSAGITCHIDDWDSDSLLELVVIP